MPLLEIRIPAEELDGEGEAVWFKPDGVFRIADSEQKKSVLFFLEVDMGTEAVVGEEGSVKDIRQKIINYQRYIQSGRYKVFESLWKCPFNGFRLLFLAHSLERMAALCRLVEQMPPSDFIWVTAQERMFSQGLADTIWARGGKMAKSAESILNWSMARPSPVAPIS